MDKGSLLEIVEFGRRALGDSERAEFDTELAAKLGLASETAGPLAVAETAAVVPVAEALTPEAPILTPETLMATFNTGYESYTSQVASVNAERAKAKGRKKDKPPGLEVVPVDTVRAKVAEILATPGVIEDLQKSIDYFTAHPEADSPDAGFDIVIVPEELTSVDDTAIANDLQPNIPNERGYTEAYHRPDRYNDKRVPEVTGKGFRVVFAPRHYNVPKANARRQITWAEGQNASTTATMLRTATDAEALAQISNLAAAGELDDPGPTRFHRSYFRRFDQTPVDDGVSNVCVYGDGELSRGWSYGHDDCPARALVVPKA